jgi:hypothetical protein
VKPRIVRALAWLQFRTLVNRLTKSSHRDGVEQASRWSEAVIVVILAALALPLGAALAGAALFGGWSAARSPDAITPVAVAAGFALVLPFAWMLLRPLGMLGGTGLERGVLLRLLPIPEALLRNVEVVRTIADPVFLLFAPALLLLPVGAIAAGDVALALVALAAGLAFLAIVALVGSLASLVAQLMLRGRRRAELFTFVFLVVLSGMGLLPQFFTAGRGHPAAGPGHVAAGPRPTIGWPARPLPLTLRIAPPAAYASALVDVASGRTGSATIDVALMVASALGLYWLGAPIHRRLVSTPESGPRGAASPHAGRRTLRLPLVDPVVSAVALSELRALLRTVRGKMAVVYPALMTLLFALVLARHGGAMPGLPPFGPALLGALAVFSSVGTAGAFACNQFAIQGAGLILEFLVPLRERNLSAGKLLAAGMLVALSLLLALLPLVALFPGVSPAVLIALWLAGIATYAGASPAAVVLSALLAKPVELSRIGRAGQPSAAANLAYLLALAVAGAPAAILIAVSLHAHSPWRAAALSLVYAVLAIGFARVVLPATERIVIARRENLALVAAGR